MCLGTMIAARNLDALRSLTPGPCFGRRDKRLTNSLALRLGPNSERGYTGKTAVRMEKRQDMDADDAK